MFEHFHSHVEEVLRPVLEMKLAVVSVHQLAVQKNSMFLAGKIEYAARRYDISAVKPVSAALGSKLHLREVGFQGSVAFRDEGWILLASDVPCPSKISTTCAS